MRAPALRLPGAFAAAAFTVQFAMVAAQSLGWPVSTATSAWLLPVKPDRSDRVTLHNLVLATCPASATDRINVVGPEYPQLNANSMAFFGREGAPDVRLPVFLHEPRLCRERRRPLPRARQGHAHARRHPATALGAARQPRPVQHGARRHAGSRRVVAGFHEGGQVARYDIFEQKDAP